MNKRPLIDWRTMAGAHSVVDRFWKKVARDNEADGCWIWTAAQTPKGYGLFSVSRGWGSGAHRLSYSMAFGQIPDGMVICHRCDNPRCVRPSHLFLGTQSDNLKDAVEKGRHYGKNRSHPHHRS